MRKAHSEKGRRTLDRRLAEELTAEELKLASGGGDTGPTFDSSGNEND
jgi:hypothetical protein